ncbi:YjfI family protein [Phenylobacterium sp.]|uniref:YjfI family protein n=1 Tax=Phenylobacterium sp. TaxID=1871053 RepID=UPI002F3FB82C
MPPTARPSAVNAAERTRAWRDARRRMGLVKLELWVPPAARADIQAAVRAILIASSRGPAPAHSTSPTRGTRPMDQVIDIDWTVKTLSEALQTTALAREGEMTVRVMEGADPVVRIVMHEHGDLPIYLSVGAEQIVVSALLWPVDEQEDRHAFNEFLLKAQKIVPLSNFGITTVAGRDYYEVFGELACKTTLQTVLIELRMLAENAIRAASDLRDSFSAAA